MPDLDMTPYAAFVWSAYGISALILVGLTLHGVMKAVRSARRLTDLESQT